MDRIEFTLPGMLPRPEAEGMDPALPPANALLQNRLEHQSLPSQRWQSALRLDRPSPFAYRPASKPPRLADGVLHQLERRSLRLPPEQQEQALRMLEAITQRQQDRLAIDARTFADRRW